MRAKDKAEVADLVRAQLAPVNDYLAKIMAALAGVSNEIMDAVGDIKPASVELTQEMADDIVRKIHGPLTINKQFSDWIAEQGKFHEAFALFQIGYGSDAGRGEIRLKGNGTMQLMLRDNNGADLWSGTFVPSNFGRSE